MPGPNGCLFYAPRLPGVAVPGQNAGILRGNVGCPDQQNSYTHRCDTKPKHCTAASLRSRVKKGAQAFS